MFYSITGKVIYSDPSAAVIECGGVGFKCNISLNTAKRLPQCGEQAKLFTYLAVREDSLTLYGFYDLEELECFKQLITVSGVGAKAAISVLSGLTPYELSKAVMTGDVKKLKTAQGIGVKMAQRIALELKGKLDLARDDTDVAQHYDSNEDYGAGSELKAAVEALVSLGYTASEAERAVMSLDSTMSAENIIREALKILSRQV